MAAGASPQAAVLGGATIAGFFAAACRCGTYRGQGHWQRTMTARWITVHHAISGLCSEQHYILAQSADSLVAGSRQVVSDERMLRFRPSIASMRGWGGTSSGMCMRSTVTSAL